MRRNYKLVVSVRVVESGRSQLTVDLVGHHINVRVNDIILASKLTYYVRIMLNGYAYQYAHFISGVISAPLINTSNKNFILKYFRCRDRKRTETRKGMEGISITHSCIPLYTVYLQHIIILVTKILFLDVGMEKENWDRGYLYYPFLHSTVYCALATHNYNITVVECRNG